MDPQVIHLIMCDGVRAARNNLLRAHINGLQLVLRPRQELPVEHDATVYAVLWGFVGRGVLWVRVVEDWTGRLIAGGRRHPVVFPRRPGELVALRFNLRNCPLKQFGQHRIELVNGEEVLAYRPFWVEPKE
ncbi:MAG: hypothetical protein J2P46_02640 [Zavarzinella sp.]|nr:hypothetical protein [Zavarzinella sp.]